MKIFLRLRLSFCLVYLGFWSCHDPSAQQQRVFCYNQPEGIATLDPAFAKSQPIIWATHQLYSTLVEIGPEMSVTPLLASGWEVSEDRLTYIFYLRTDVFFHDSPVFPGGKGRRMVAGDIVYSFKRLLDPSVASPGAWVFNGRVDDQSPFRAINDSAFELKLKSPFPPILGILSMPYCSVVAREAVTKYGKDFGQHPCGTGPFMLKSWDEGLAMILEKNPHYFEKDREGKSLPYIDAVKVSFLDSKATEFLAFRQGQIDFINDIETSFKDEILTRGGNLKKEWEGRIVLQKHPYLNTEYLGILNDTTNPLVTTSPLRIKKVRQALNCAFDRRKMMLYLRNSIGTPAEGGFIPAGLPGFDSSSSIGYRYDPERAARLLKEAGYPGGAGLGEIRLLTIPSYADLATFIAREWQETGIRVKVEAVQRATLLGQMAKSEALFFRGSWIADYPDAENYLSVFYGPNPAPPNYTRYHNPVFDSLYSRSLLELNDSIRYGLYRHMDRLMMEDAPVIPLWYDMAIHLVQPNVSGFYPNAQNILELRRTQKK